MEKKMSRIIYFAIENSLEQIMSYDALMQSETTKRRFVFIFKSLATFVALIDF